MEHTKNKFALGKSNFIIIGIGAAIIIIGFILMLGDSTTMEAFQPNIFSVRRIKIAPVVSLIGFLSIIYGIIHKPKQ